MNKRILIVVATLAVLIVGGVATYALTGASEPRALVQADETEPAGSPTSVPATSVPATSGTYVDYDSSAIANAKGTVLLFFHAPWCQQCRLIESDILAVGVPTGVTIVKVDYDSHQDLRQKYGVTLQTTFVEVDSSGTELQKYVAYDDPRLSVVIAEML